MAKVTVGAFGFNCDRMWQFDHLSASFFQCLKYFSNIGHLCKSESIFLENGV